MHGLANKNGSFKNIWEKVTSQKEIQDCRALL